MEPEESNRVTKVQAIQAECVNCYREIGSITLEIASLESKKKELIHDAAKLNKKAGDIFANMTTEERKIVMTPPAPATPTTTTEEAPLEVVNG